VRVVQGGQLGGQAVFADVTVVVGHGLDGTVHILQRFGKHAGQALAERTAL
jgi:hypothetical protein